MIGRRLGAYGVHAVCQQIPDLGMHPVRYYVGHANRARRRLAEAREVQATADPRTAQRS